MGILQTQTDCRIRVLNDRVLILPEEAEYQNVSKEVYDALKSKTIVLPEVYEGWAKKTPEWGTIASYGDKCKYKWVVGQRVHFARLASATMELNGTKYSLVREYDIDIVYES